MKSKEQKETGKLKKKSSVVISKELTPEETKIRKRFKIDLLICVIHVVLIEAYFVVTNIISESMPIQEFEIYLKASYIIFIVMAVLMFETAYKKGRKNFAIHGIELTLLAIHILLIEKNITRANILSTSYIWILYLCLKALLIYTKENRRRLKQISDISQIVKEEKPTKKVAKKRKT